MQEACNCCGLPSRCGDRLATLGVPSTPWVTCHSQSRALQPGLALAQSSLLARLCPWRTGCNRGDLPQFWDPGVILGCWDSLGMPQA